MKQLIHPSNASISCQNCVYWQELSEEELKKTSIDPEWYQKYTWGYCYYDHYDRNLRNAAFCSKFDRR